MFNIDIWYQNEKIVKADCFFYPNENVYRGNLYNENGKIVGDFSGQDSIEIENKLQEIIIKAEQ